MRIRALQIINDAFPGIRTFRFIVFRPAHMEDDQRGAYIDGQVHRPDEVERSVGIERIDQGGVRDDRSNVRPRRSAVRRVSSRNRGVTDLGSADPPCVPEMSIPS